MEKLIEISDRKKAGVSQGFQRSLFSQIDTGERMIIITGFRGAGKTTGLLQMMSSESVKECI